MKKRSEHSGEDILESLSRLSAEADWTEEEIDEALKEDGVDPEHLVSRVIADIRTEFPEFPQQPEPVRREARSKLKKAEASQDESRRNPVQEVAGRHSESSMTSLFDAGARLGLDKFGLAARLRLSIGIVTKLNQRLIECSTIPADLIRELAATVGQSVEDILRYLQCQPRLASGLSFKAEEAPQLPEPQDFAEAVEKDRSLSPERKKELLEMAGRR